MRRSYHPIPPDAIRIALPDVFQVTDYSCGAACVLSIAKYYGVGPDDEVEFITAMHFDHRVGSNPDQIIRTARRYGLRCQPYPRMTIPQLKAELDEAHPVMLMLQAWGEKPGRKYARDWKDGHWVIAIGYSDDVIFFEDPSLAAIRGYLHTDELKRRWRDTGRFGRHMPRYGVAIWRPSARESFYATRAERIA